MEWLPFTFVALCLLGYGLYALVKKAVKDALKEYELEKKQVNR